MESHHCQSDRPRKGSMCDCQADRPHKSRKCSRIEDPKINPVHVQFSPNAAMSRSNFPSSSQKETIFLNPEGRFCAIPASTPTVDKVGKGTVDKVGKDKNISDGERHFVPGDRSKGETGKTSQRSGCYRTSPFVLLCGARSGAYSEDRTISSRC